MSSTGLSGDPLEVVFGSLNDSMDLWTHRALRLVCKAWRVVLAAVDVDPRVLRRNSQLPLTREGQLQAMRRYESGRWWGCSPSTVNPWGKHEGEEYYMMRWHADVLDVVNNYVIEGGDDNVFCFYSCNVMWGRTDFVMFLRRMGAPADDSNFPRFDKQHGNAYTQTRAIKAQLVDTARKGLFPVVAIDITSYLMDDKAHMQRIACMLRSLKSFRILGIAVPVIVFAKCHADGPHAPFWLSNWLPHVASERVMWYDTGQAESGYGYPVDSARLPYAHW